MEAYAKNGVEIAYQQAIDLLKKISQRTKEAVFGHDPKKWRASEMWRGVVEEKLLEPHQSLAIVKEGEDGKYCEVLAGPYCPMHDMIRLEMVAQEYQRTSQTPNSATRFLLIEQDSA